MEKVNSLPRPNQEQRKKEIGLCFFIASFLFCISGVTNQLIANEINVKGGASLFSFIEPAILSGSQIFFASFSWICGEPRFTKEDLLAPTRYPYMIFIELGANVLFFAGIYLVGSGLNTVLYSTLCIFTAFFSRVLYQVRISRQKWIAIVIILVSISLSLVGQTVLKGVSISKTFTGVAVCISAAAVYGLDYVLSEKLLLRRYTPLGTAFFFWPIMILYGLWIGFYDGFQWQSLVIDPMKKVDPNYNINEILLLYFLFFLSCGVHKISFIYSLNSGKIAAVAAAVNSCMQTALVFVSSDLIFCPHHSWNHGRTDLQSAQCLTKWKFVGFCGVLLGVFLYSLDGIRSIRGKKTELREPFLNGDFDEGTSVKSMDVNSTN